MLTDLEIMTSFATKETINGALYALKTRIDFDKSNVEELTINTKKKISDSYKQKVFVKINTILRRQIFLETDEAIKFYANNTIVLNERMDILFNMIDFINDDLDITFVPDRLFLCAFFRINAETYDIILNDARVDVTDELRRNFRNLEEMILSMTTNAMENGNLGQSAWKRLALKSKFGGNEIQRVESSSVPNKVILATAEDVTKRLNTSYNFAELQLEENNKKEG